MTPTLQSRHQSDAPSFPPPRWIEPGVVMSARARLGTALPLPLPIPSNATTLAQRQHWFAELYRRVEKSLYARALLFTAHPADAWDAVQRTGERAWRNLVRREPPAQGLSWILTILDNVLVSSWRFSHRHCRHQPTDEVDQVAAAPADERPAWDGLDRVDIEAAIAELPEERRRAYQLCELDGLSYEAAALELGVRRGTIGSRLVRARAQLRGILERRLAERTAGPC